MGNTKNSFGKPVFAATPTQTVVDMQAIADFADKFAMFRFGTRSEREALPTGERRDGMHWYETDTGAEWRLINGEWRQSNSFQSRFRGAAMNITPTQTRMDWNGAGASFGVPDFTYAGGMFTCVQPGVFQLTGQVVVQPAGARVAFVVLVYKNGDLFFRAPSISATEGSVAAPIATAVQCNVGDKLNVDVYANTAIGVDVAIGMNVFNIARVG